MNVDLKQEQIKYIKRLLKEDKIRLEYLALEENKYRNIYREMKMNETIENILDNPKSSL